MKYVAQNQPIETRKKIMAQQEIWGQLKHRSRSYDQANEIVKRYYANNVDKLVIKGS